MRERERESKRLAYLFWLTSWSYFLWLACQEDSLYRSELGLQTKSPAAKSTGTTVSARASSSKTQTNSTFEWVGEKAKPGWVVLLCEVESSILYTSEVYEYLLSACVDAIPPSFFLSFRSASSHRTIMVLLGGKSRDWKISLSKCFCACYSFAPRVKKKFNHPPRSAAVITHFLRNRPNPICMGFQIPWKTKGGRQRSIEYYDETREGRRKRLGICKGSALHALSQCPNRFELDSLVVVAFFSNPQWF